MKNWRKKEKRDAKDFEGKQMKGSGSQWYAPGDVKTDDYLIDSKTTDNKSFGVTLKIWDKLAEEAAFVQRIPLLSVKIQETELCILSRMDLLNLLRKAKSQSPRTGSSKK
jgi:hypothetical protein